MSTDHLRDVEAATPGPTRINWPPIRAYLAVVSVISILGWLFLPIADSVSIGGLSTFLTLLIHALLCGLLSTIGIFYAFSFALPWLWFRNAWCRVIVAFMVPMVQWSLLLVGGVLRDGGKFDVGTFPFFATALLFGSLPSLTLRWWWKWHIAAVGYEKVDCRMTIVDLFGLSLVAAMILAVVRLANQSKPGMFVSWEAWMGLAIMGSIGVLVAIPTLTAICIFLSPKIRLTPSSAIGIGLTFLIVVGTSFLLANIGFYPSNPLLGSMLTVPICLICITGTASGIALLLRRSGLRLSTGRDGQSRSRAPL